MQSVAGETGIKDIARVLKVSIGTADRALHGRPGVKEKTMARVLQIAKRMDTSPILPRRSRLLPSEYFTVQDIPHMEGFVERLYPYTGDRSMVQALQQFVNYELENGLTPKDYVWSQVPYPSVSLGSRRYTVDDRDYSRDFGVTQGFD